MTSSLEQGPHQVGVPTPARPPRPPLSTGHLAALSMLLVVAAAGYVADVVTGPADASELTTASTARRLALAATAFGSGLTLTVSLMRRRSWNGAGRRSGRSITFVTPAATADRTAADRTAAASRRALLIAVIGTVTSAVVLAASLALGVAALPAAERACARNPYPDACLNDAEFPLSFLGTAGLTAFLGCGLTTLVLAVRRRRRDTPERER